MNYSNKTAINRRQNELRHFAQNWAFLGFTKGGNIIAFPPSSPPCNVVPIENNKHPNFEWKRQGRGADSLFSKITLFEYNVCQQFCRRLKTKGTFLTLQRTTTVSYNLAQMNTNCLHDGPGRYISGPFHRNLKKHNYLYGSQ